MFADYACRSQTFSGLSYIFSSDKENPISHKYFIRKMKTGELLLQTSCQGFRRERGKREGKRERGKEGKRERGRWKEGGKEGKKEGRSQEIVEFHKANQRTNAEQTKLCSGEKDTHCMHIGIFKEFVQFP